jgi:hypothetical protein
LSESVATVDWGGCARSLWISYHSTDQPFAEYGIKDAATVQALGRVLENPQPFNVKREVQRWTII